MPFDNTPPETTTDVFSLARLVEWLKMQPGETTYVFGNNADCLYCRYLRAQGFSDVSMGGFGTGRADGQDIAFEFEGASVPARQTAGKMPGVSEPHTYRGALTRARRLLAEQDGA